ncbi:MCP four helix bundle domain-containing protein [Roseateles sp. UC29_93]|uniref:MCP four helix bundle domain-containing protein n=1 Tax=Roseateles sp. UC29_93 TaxID=3350177 RepID=UPI0036735966
MKSIQSLSTGTRLAAVFLLLLALSALSTGVVVSRLAAVSASLRQIERERLPLIQRLGDMSDQVNAVGRGLRNALIFEDETRIAAALVDTGRQTREIAATMESLKHQPALENGAADIARLSRSFSDYVPLQQRFVALLKDRHREEAGALLVGELRAAQLKTMADLDALKDRQTALISAAAEAGEEGYLNARGLLIALCAAMLVGAAVVGSQRIRRDLAPGTGEAVARLSA